MRNMICRALIVAAGSAIGVDFVDSSDACDRGWNEELSLARYRVIATSTSSQAKFSNLLTVVAGPPGMLGGRLSAGRVGSCQ
jgi:hypothetical protein